MWLEAEKARNFNAVVWVLGEVNGYAGEYWQHLRTHSVPMPSPHDDVVPCVRFVDVEGRDRLRQTEDLEGSKALHAELSGGFRRYGEIKQSITPTQRTLLRKLVVAGLVDVRMVA